MTKKITDIVERLSLFSAAHPLVFAIGLALAVVYLPVIGIPDIVEAWGRAQATAVQTYYREMGDISLSLYVWVCRIEAVGWRVALYPVFAFWYSKN